MSILVTGANGFVGRALATELLRRGHNVRCAVRDGALCGRLLCSEVVSVGEIDHDTNWTPSLDGVHAVVHLAARVHVMRENSPYPLAAFREVNVAGTERLARAAAAAGVRRFVFVSSIGVNGYFTKGVPFMESSSAAPYSPYTVSKLEAERVLSDVSRETGMEIVILRPTLVYGPGNPGNMRSLLDIIERGIPLPLASVHNRRSLVYVGNLVGALTACVMHENAKGNTYLVSDGNDVSTPELIQRIALAMGKSPRLFPTPESVLRVLGIVTGKSTEVSRLIDSLVVDSSKIRRDLCWQPPYTLDEGMSATVDWYRQHRNINQ